LLTGKRLQPYYDRADRPRIDAWQTIVNGRLGLHDPNAPENRRVRVMQPQPAVHYGLPGIDARTVGAVVIRL
ncbi:hypothetical protein, partial [Klebsiella pneumoniae]|uniref:hypothetical protein n=1 Tax=Klebsiella pneumoniae TaxID=573 RepID=UPI000AF2A29B